MNESPNSLLAPISPMESEEVAREFVQSAPANVTRESTEPKIDHSAERMSATQRATPAWIGRGHIPGLDGLRAVAVLMVVMTHCVQTVGFPDWPLIKQIGLRGAIGVDVFFAISGFLITTLLVRELERDGEIGLKRFYLRRFLRIMPAYIGLMVAVAVCQRFEYFQMQSRDWIGALTYTTNFLFHPSWELGHSWSLSIEEHFYLLWPFVLYVGGSVLGWRVGIACVISCWLIRCGIAFGLLSKIFPAGSELANVTYCAQMAESWTFTRMDTITMGSLLALACRTSNGRAWLDRLTEPEMLWIYLITVCVSIALSQSGKYMLCVAYTLNGTCIALLMWGAIQSKGVVRRVLSNRLLKVIGLGSYSIYLWQQLFIHPRHAGWIHEFPQNIAFAMGAAFLSYWLIERPMNRLKDRVAI